MILPDELTSVNTVGRFQRLLELSEQNADLKNKLRHMLKLSPEKWEEVASHAMQAVQPDFRPRVWWCTAMRVGLLFSCKNGAVQMEQPTGGCLCVHLHVCVRGGLGLGAAMARQCKHSSR